MNTLKTDLGIFSQRLYPNPDLLYFTLSAIKTQDSAEIIVVSLHSSSNMPSEELEMRERTHMRLCYPVFHSPHRSDQS